MKLLCTKCKVLKDSDQFPTAKSRGTVYVNGPRGGKSSHCHACNAARTKEWAKSNKEKVDINARTGHLRRKFGLTLEDFDSILEKQGNVCAICTCKIDSPRVKQRNFCVDHDHNTGKVRGILCDSCNLILGNADDSIELLNKCIVYLEISNERNE